MFLALLTVGSFTVFYVQCIELIHISGKNALYTTNNNEVEYNKLSKIV